MPALPEEPGGDEGAGTAPEGRARRGKEKVKKSGGGAGGIFPLPKQWDEIAVRIIHNSAIFRK